MEKVRLITILWVILLALSLSNGFISQIAHAGTISLTADTNIPEPNQEITVQIQTDTPIWAMGLFIKVDGNAEITTAMSTVDCNQFGWEPDWPTDPYIDNEEGWVYVSGVKWDGGVEGTVGYFKFIYRSGQVSIFIYPDKEWSCAFDDYCQPVPISDETLIFGEPEPNQSDQQEEIPDLNSTDTIDDFQLPSFEDKSTRQTKNLKFYSLDIEPNGVLNSAAFKKSQSEECQNSESVDSNEFMIDALLGTIEVASDITSNQIWTADNTYHITGDISIQALLVIEAGTTVTFGPNGTLWVNSGGTLISCGTPANPIKYTADITTSSYQYYWYPVYVEPTASSATKITYSIMKNARVGLFIEDNRLDNPVENNYFFHNSFGIVESGTHLTDISNNLIYETYNRGIEVSMKSYAEIADANSHIRIENNTCHYYQDDGIVVFGADNSEDSGVVEIYNNIVSGSYEIGLAVVDWAYWAVSNTGYYNNAENSNTDEDFPVYATSNPYIDGSDDPNRCYLNQSCPFINAGLKYIEQTHLIGTTTDVNSLPDSNFIDIGFHHSDWTFSNAATGFAAGDLNKDSITDFKDLYTLVSNWLNFVTPGNSGDLNNDGTINFNDYVLLAATWQKIQGEPNIIPAISGDSNSGYVNVGASGFSSDTQQIFLLADGKYIGGIFGFWDGETLGMDVSEFGNRQKQLKLISMDGLGHITCSNIANITFPCPLNYCVLPESYEPNKPVSFSAISNGSDNVTVKVYANGGNLVWSQTYDGNNVLGNIPATITNQYEIDYVGFDKSGGALLSGGSWSISKVIDPVGPPLGDVQALIILPISSWRLRDCRQIAQVQTALASNEITYEKLGGRRATYDNVAWYAANKNIKYMYIDSHGEYRIGGIYRTGALLYDGYVVSMKQSDFAPGGAPSWCQSLGSYWETRLKSFVTMGFNYLEFAYFDCCYSGRLKINSYNQLVEGQPGQIGVFDGPHSDMSLALGMGDTSRSRAYQGWYNPVPIGMPPPWSEDEYQKWTRLEWEYLGEGYDLYWALMYVINEQTDFSPGAPVNNYRLKGQGLITDIELNRW